MQEQSKIAPSNQFRLGTLFFWMSFVGVAMLGLSHPSPIAMLSLGLMHLFLLVFANRVTPETLLLTGLLWIAILCRGAFADQSQVCRRIRLRGFLDPSGNRMQEHSTASNPGQFTLTALFFWTLFVALLMLMVALPGLTTILVVPFVLLILLAGTRRISIEAATGWAICWLFVGPLVLTPLFPPTMRSTRRPACSNNLRQLSLALLNYESAFEISPSAYTVDEAGNRLHSWRTIVLPYIEANDIYKRVDFKRPWNHRHNLALALPTPDSLQCPDSQTIGPRATTYHAIVGKNCFFQHGGRQTRLKEVTDGTSNTIHLIELGNHPIPWMSPYDMSFKQFSGLVKDSPANLLEAHTGGCNVARCDGSVQYLSSNVDPKVIQSALRIADGGPDDF